MSKINIPQEYVEVAKEAKVKVYCNKCKSIIKNRCKKSNDKLTDCEFRQSHVFKCVLHVPNTKNETTTKVLAASSVIDAIQEAEQFKATMIACNYTKQSEVLSYQNIQAAHPEKLVNKEVQQIDYSNMEYLANCMAKHIDFLCNVNVPVIRQRHRSEEHLKDIQRCFMNVMDCLEQQGYSPLDFKIADFDIHVTGEVHLYFDNKYKAYSYNRYMNILSSFFKCMIEEFELDGLKNHFSRIKRKRILPQSQNIGITRDEFDAVMNSITPENGVCTDPKKKLKQNYTPWLRNAFEFGYYTGGRLDNILYPRWCDIVLKPNGDFDYISCENYKVNKIEDRQDPETKKRIFIPITKSLESLLLRSGFDKYKDSDKYILAPDAKYSRDNMKQRISRAFSHFYDRLYPGLNKKFKHLRKTYISGMYEMYGDQTFRITGHASNDVLLKHYVTDNAKAERARLLELQQSAH